ncbi:MAG: TraB/GumN family protein [Tatlockia sp.]|nr:TraB/GumN family protein [Tatlockia sp.]
MFYEIISPEGLKSYLLGTLHVKDEEIVTLPLEVKRAFDNADHYVFESDSCDLITLHSEASTLILEWKLANQYLTDPPGMAEPLIALCECPSLFKAPSSKQREELDSQLFYEAQRRGQRVDFLETHRQILKVLLGYQFTYPLHVNFYEWKEKNINRFQNMALAHLAKLKSAYLNNDLQTLTSLWKSKLESQDAPTIVDMYFKSISYERDITLTESMKPFIKEGGVFFVVGAGHLPGITQKLAEEGYTVNSIPLSQRLYPISGSIEDAQKVAAFRKIYCAMYAGQTSFFKKKADHCKLSQLTVQEITNYIRVNPTSRSAVAWELAQIHYMKFSINNQELFKSIHQYCFKNSSSFFSLFKQSNNFPQGYAGEIQKRINEARDDSRTGLIRNVLN